MSALFFRNPVLLRELRERVAGRRTMVMITLWLLILAAIVAVIYSTQTGRRFGDPFGGGVSQLANVGQSLYEWVLFFMLGLVLFLVPGFTAAAIAGERERQTLLPLQVTLLRPSAIIFGKVASSLAFTVLLLVATLPLLAFAFLIGGITIGEVFSGLAIVMFSAFALACITVMCSALVKRVQGAIVLSYGLVLLMVVGSFVAYAMAWVIDESRGIDQANPPTYILATNPLAAVADVSGARPSVDELWFGGPQQDVDTPLALIRQAMYPVDVWGGGFEPVGFDQFGNPIFPDLEVDQAGGLEFWQTYLIVMGVLSVVSVVVAARRVRTPAKTER